MTAREIERFRRIEAIFDAAVEYPQGAARDAFVLTQAADSNPEEGLREEVQQLLEDHERVLTAVPALPESLPQFGPWRAIRLLGRGGMGTVYLAERSDGAFRMMAAVKVVPLALASADIEDRFRRERQFLASLDHPKVARLIDGGVTGTGLPYLVMEFVDGQTIDQYCEAQELDARARITMMRQVLEALIYVHGQQVMHRDLKPSNILVDDAGNVKLLDFGTARLVDVSGDIAITRTGVFAFTPECASPEQVQGKPLTFASDIYSSGVLLYRLLTGRPPYRLTDYSPAAIADTIGRTEPDPSGLDGPLDAILSSALQKDPESRYASAAEMDADLARYLEGEPVHARRPRRLRKIVMAAAAMVLCAVAAWAWLYRNASPPASIAVLPFTSVDPAARYLSNGVTDELTEALSRLKKLRVIAPASVAQIRGKTSNAVEAGRMLHVTNVLEGSATRTGDRIKIVAKLEHIPDGAVLWSDTYDRQESGLTTIQSELTAEIARSLKVAAPAHARHVPKAQAHEFVMKANYEMQQLTPQSVTQAEEDYQHAIDLDPEYAMAYLALALAKHDQTVARGSTGATEGERKGAEQLVMKALELDPEMPTARASLALWAMQYDWDWQRAERELRLAVAGAPSSTAEGDYAFFLIFHNRFREADAHILRMQDLDSISSASTMNLVTMRYLEGRFAQVREAAQQVAAAYPKMLVPQQLIGASYIAEGHPELALPIFREVEPRFPQIQLYEAMALARMGQREGALRLIRPFEDKYPNPGVPMQWFALVYGSMGDEPNTVKWLGRSADLHEWQALNLAVNPIFAPMRSSPGFRALEKRMGLVP